MCGAFLSLGHPATAAPSISGPAYSDLAQFVQSIQGAEVGASRADNRLTVEGVRAALRGDQASEVLSTTKNSPQRLYADNSADSGLANFVQLIAAEQPKLISADATPANGDAFSALREFAQRVGADRPESLRSQSKVAEADSAFGALRELFGGKSSQPEPPAVSGKPKATRAAAPKAAEVEAHFIGEKACMGCHAQYAAEFEKTLMGRIGKTQKGKFACENCHGPGSAHVKAGGGRGVGGIISFRSDDKSRSVEENNAICLACHEKGDRVNWRGSTHETRDVACTNCHTVMKDVSVKKQLKTKVEADTCFQCHQNKRAQIWRTSHMPVREGKMTCTNCHNPHGSFSESLLKEATVNDTCYKCHAEKRGPFLWEHPPVRENCLNCHDPHGSNNDFLLKISRPRLCQQCHAGGQHNSNPRNPLNALYAQGRECQNCHSNHHGSNNPAGARFMR